MCFNDSTEERHTISMPTRSSSRRTSSKMTFLRAAEIILGESSRPLHAREIVERAIARGLISPKGRTPDHTLTATVWKDMHHGRRRNSTFVLIGTVPLYRKFWLKRKLA